MLLTYSGIYDTIKERLVSKIEKLKRKFFEKPVRNDMTIDEIIRLAKSYGCEIVTGGNHQVRIVHRESGRVIPLPRHGSIVKEAYIVELKELFEEIESCGGNDNDQVSV